MGRLFDSKQFRTDLELSGSFSGSFQGDGSSLTNVNVTPGDLPSGLISSSAQIASDISGSFGAPSSSLSTRITNLKTDSGSFSTRISSNELITAKTLISSSAQIALDISGSFTAPSASFSTRISSNETITSKTLVSSSAQIASDISGSFGGPSASFSTRVSANEIVTAKTLISSSNQFNNINSPFTGSFSGSFQGDGSGLTNIVAVGTLSSSAQIASDISGAFAGPSSSFSTRVSANEIVTAKTLLSGSTQITEFGFVSQSGGIVDLPNTKIQYANVYSSLGDLPPAGNYHGMFAHVHGTGKGYYAHAGEWIELANISVTSSIDSNTSAISTLNSSGLLSSSAQIGSEISGSFTQPSGSFSSRVTTLEDQSIYSGSFSGSFQGDGSGLENIPASGITGLNLSRIASGSVTASISPDGGFQVNTNITASNISSSGTLRIQEIDAFKMNVVHFTASFITASTIETSGSNVFGDEPSDTHTFIGNIIAKNNISSSGYVSASNFIGNGSGLTNVFEGTSASQSISTRITTNESAINTLNTSGLLSGSAQIATEISGAFGASSASFSTRTTLLENKTIYSGSFSGSFQGNGSGLTNIPASGITGLNLSQIASGSATASIAPDKGFQVNTDTEITGSLRVTGSGLTVEGAPGQVVASFSDNGSSAATDGVEILMTYQNEGIDINSSGYQSAFIGNGGNRLGVLKLSNWATNTGLYFNGYYTTSPLNATYQKNWMGNALVINRQQTASPSSTIYALDVAGPSIITGSNSNGLFGLHVSSSGGSGSMKLEGDAQITGSLDVSGSAKFITHAPFGGFEIIPPDLNDWTGKIKLNGQTLISDRYQTNQQYITIGGDSQTNQVSINEGVFPTSTKSTALTVYQRTDKNYGVIITGRDSGGVSPFLVQNEAGSLFVKVHTDGKFELPTGDISGSATSTASFGTYVGDGSQLDGVQSFPFSGSAIITGSLIVSQSVVDFTDATVLLPAATVPLINPKVEYVNCAAITASGTTVPLPNGLTFISSSDFEYIEIFINGLRMRYDVDFMPPTTASIKYFVSIPSGSEITYKSLNRP